MALRAVDMAMPVQRTTEMTQNQRGESRPEMQQQQFAARMAREVNQQETTVQMSPQSEDARLQKDGRGNNGGYAGGKGKKKEKEEEQQGKKTNKPVGSMFDMSI